MIPPSMQAQQAMRVQQSMQKPQDPLMQALAHQEMIGDALKQTASHKQKMLKLKQKYQAKLSPMGGM